MALGSEQRMRIEGVAPGQLSGRFIWKFIQRDLIFKDHQQLRYLAEVIAVQIGDVSQLIQAVARRKFGRQQRYYAVIADVTRPRLAMLKIGRRSQIPAS